MSTADVARRWALPEVEDEPLADLLVRWCNRILSQDPRL